MSVLTGTPSHLIEPDWVDAFATTFLYYARSIDLL